MPRRRQFTIPAMMTAVAVIGVLSARVAHSGSIDFFLLAFTVLIAAALPFMGFGLVIGWILFTIGCGPTTSTKSFSSDGFHDP